ncbi:MAG: glycosyltransferase family 39 protein [Anaerolineaceae bacterium]|nr:glycosyltransferase family 39 protein [Anaerolineaceae bacterium]
MESYHKPSSTLLDRPLTTYLSRLNLETLLIALILILAVVSRFYNAGLRVMSHDEVNHVVPSFDLYEGKGYRHDPVTHGPLQFHLIALSYFFFGDNDFSSRIPAALFSTAAVAFVLFAFRRYLGRSGALIAGALFLISPYMLFYGRYTRNEGLIELLGVVMLFAVLRYLEKGDRLSLTLLTVSIVLHFTAKETAFIYAAQLLLFIGVLFSLQVVRVRWPSEGARKRFLALIGFALLAFLLALGLAVWNTGVGTSTGGTETQIPEAPVSTFSQPLTMQFIGEAAALGAALVLAVVAVVLLVRSLGWARIRSIRSFDILVLVGTLILPQLSAFPVKIIGWNPIDYQVSSMLRTGIFVVLFFAISIVVGLWWNRKLWLVHAALFYGTFIVLYTTFFTNGQGFFTGLVGALGYWLSQQGVERGSQPWYYFVAVQVPVYEYLAALGTLLAAYFGFKYKRFSTRPDISPASAPAFDERLAESEMEDTADVVPWETSQVPTLAFLLYWSFTAIIAYSIAGEKMPWLTVHIALPLLLAAGWGFGYLVDTTPWKKIAGRNGIVAVLLIPVFLTSLASLLGALLGDQPPFMGKTLEQLSSTSNFLLAALVAAGSLAGIFYLLKTWRPREVGHLMAVFFIGLLGVLTARTSYTASFINYDNAKEFLVYAHAARGPKEVLAQVEEISRRTTGGLDIQVAYDNDALYPYWWYFRNYPNHRWYTDKPTRDLAELPLIIAGDATSSKVEPIVKNNYVVFDYMRLWWPMQDYFNLTWERIWNAVKNPKMRSALFQIWLNRDYEQYAALTNKPDLKLETWQPSAHLKFFVRKDVIAEIWNYGSAPAVAKEQLPQDPYLGNILPLIPERTFGGAGNAPGQMMGPRGVAAGPDGSIYVADSRNNRIQRLSPDGEVLNTWGSFADVAAGDAPGGTFNEPWGVAVSPDGSVYVADTWNHRIQKFSASGEFVKMWGYFGQGETPEAFWGPRDVAVNAQGEVFVTDTGNKRVAVFNADGKFITEFGSIGVGLGFLDEPVGIAVGREGQIYVVDTWNQRVQIFSPDAERTQYFPIQAWDISGWYGQSLENKPYIAVDGQGNVYVTDPEGYRILEFDAEGKFLRGWSDWAAKDDLTTLPVGIAIDQDGRMWVSDSGNNVLYRFLLP